MDGTALAHPPQHERAALDHRLKLVAIPPAKCIDGGSGRVDDPLEVVLALVGAGLDAAELHACGDKLGYYNGFGRFTPPSETVRTLISILTLEDNDGGRPAETTP